MAGGFKAPFIVVGLILIVSTFVLSKVVPHETKHEIVERFNASHSIEVQNSNGKDSFWQVCSIPYISLTIIATAACEMGLVFKEPIMQLRLLHDFNLNIGIVGVIFSIDVLTFCGTCFILGRIDEKKKPFHRLIAAGLFVFSLAHLLSGPSPWIFPDSLGILITGSLLLGVGGSFIKTSSIASMHQTYTFLFGKTTPRAQNAIASVNCSGQALGQIVGPILGSFMTDWLTYRLAFFISSIMFLVFAIVFTMVTNCEEKRRRGGILDQKYTKMPSENNGVQMGE
jgi:MFS family permease